MKITKLCHKLYSDKNNFQLNTAFIHYCFWWDPPFIDVYLHVFKDSLLVINALINSW